VSDIPKSNETFIQRQLKKIIINKNDLQKLIDTKKGIYNSVKSWSTLKLIFLNYVADVYSRIMKNRNYFKDKYFYVDLFSGSGINTVDDSSGDLIFGSPLIVATRYPFTKMFFCDSNEDYTSALDERLKVTGLDKDKFKIYDKDCNNILDDIISQIKNGHSLIFIDPYGMQITWKSIEKILQLKADVIMNFQTSEIVRGIEKSGEPTNACKSFFKDSNEAMKIYSKPIITRREELLKLYIKDIENTRLQTHSNVITEKVRVRKDEKYYYDLIFITRQTRGGSPWLNTIKKSWG